MNGFSYHRSGGVYYDGTVNYGAGWSFNTYHVIGIAVDWTNKRAYWHVDGVWANSADPSAGTGFYDITTNASNVAASVDAIPAWRTRAATTIEQVSVNFGQNPSFGGELTAGTFTDDSGKGLFKYAPPTGFLALCEDNLPTPAIADPGDYMRTVLYAGDGNSGRSITGVGFQPDLVWLKSRTNNASHRLSDSVRGVNKQLMSNTTEVEATFTTMLTSFDSDGFALGDNAGINGSGYTNVAWCWKAGGAAVSNTDGTITSQVSANQTAGFSIVSYDGSGNVNDTVGHSLGKTPSFIILKARTQAYFWRVYHSHFGTSPTEGLYLNSTVISAVHDEHGGIASVTPTTFGFGTDGTNTLTGVNKSGDTYIAYCWTEIEGYSKFGSYVGNGSADGPFVYCGFKPAFLMIKLVTGSQRDWHIYDSSRNPTNPVGLNLRPSSASTDTDEPGIDFLSNGFKIRSNYVFSNESGQTIIFMAFAESPFQTANAK